MLYSEITINGIDYKMRLDAKTSVALERKIKQSPLNIFMTAQDGTLPKLEDIISIFHASLQKYQHNFTENDTYDLYDKYIEEGGTYVDFIPVVLDIFKVSGFFKENTEAKN